jgi:hypothetical protein
MIKFITIVHARFPVSKKASLMTLRGFDIAVILFQQHALHAIAEAM